MGSVLVYSSEDGKINDEYTDDYFFDLPNINPGSDISSFQSNNRDDYGQYSSDLYSDIFSGYVPAGINYSDF